MKNPLTDAELDRLATDPAASLQIPALVEELRELRKDRQHVLRITQVLEVARRKMTRCRVMGHGGRPKYKKPFDVCSEDMIHAYAALSIMAEILGLKVETLGVGRDAPQPEGERTS